MKSINCAFDVSNLIITAYGGLLDSYAGSGNAGRWFGVFSGLSGLADRFPSDKTLVRAGWTVNGRAGYCFF